MNGVLELELQLPAAGSRDVRRRLHEQLRQAILAGRLAPGVQLPASRALADQLGLSRNTVMAVYDMLLGEGCLVARPGAGTFVAPAASRPAGGEAIRAAPAVTHNLRPGRPDATRFPFDIWGRLTGRALRRYSRDPAVYREPCGHPALREAIAGHLSFARAIACAPADVVVTVGAQQAFDLMIRALTPPERRVVVVENPGYPAARAAFAAAGADVRAVPVDAEGLVVEALPPDTALICVTPSQFPTGVTLSPHRRQALLAFAAAHDAVIVEDDYGGEFRFDGPPLDTLRMLDRDERVVYVGTFSQSLLPALRIGFVVAPGRFRAALTEARAHSDWHGPAIEHATLADFIGEGHLARHVRRMRGVYAERRAVLLRALARDGAGLLDPVAPASGLHLAARLAAGVDVAAAIARAARSGVAVEDLAAFTAGDASAPGLALGYGQIEAGRIDEAVAILAEAIRASTSRP
ncbi:PLP-dependent aminotransferase family protein [Caulobacter sp. CCG-8]|uniref:MocR-like pyridoxine biosynthesis transcription factor PdxR n=1 Tax=Caulobacter sp. CCG-8 TaxID=3127958 RepID=UPI00307D351A